MFSHYSYLKLLSNLTSNFAQLFLGWSFTKCVFFSVDQKSEMATTARHNIGPYGKMKKLNSQKQ